MANNLVWITGASSGIGLAMAGSVPWPETQVVGISRTMVPEPGVEHLALDLSTPEAWERVGCAVREALHGFDGERAVFVHSAGTLDPIGPAADVRPDEYLRSIMVNNVASLMLGKLFVEAAAGSRARCTLVMISSGAAHKVYAGWSAYGSSKAAMDQWVRIVGAEQELRGGVRVFGIAPGVVDTPMQTQLRNTDPEQFPPRQRFLDLHRDNLLVPPDVIAHEIWQLVDGDVRNGTIVDLRELMAARAK